MANTKKTSERSVNRVARKESSNPSWFLPVMLGFMIVGFLWILLFYISLQRLPIEAIGFWNVLVGFGIMFVGFIMATKWK